MADIRVAVLGDSESIKGFAAVGLDIFPCDNPDDAPALFRRISDGGNYGVIYVTEELTARLERELQRIENRLLPSVVPIPGVKGNNGCGVARLKGFVEKAVGSDIIFND
jgi:V/A-type H+-transporting ATPase subunit F